MGGGAENNLGGHLPPALGAPTDGTYKLMYMYHVLYVIK